MFIDCATTLVALVFRFRRRSADAFTNYMTGVDAMETLPESDAPMVEPTMS